MCTRDVVVVALLPRVCVDSMNLFILTPIFLFVAATRATGTTTTPSLPVEAVGAAADAGDDISTSRLPGVSSFIFKEAWDRMRTRNPFTPRLPSSVHLWIDSPEWFTPSVNDLRAIHHVVLQSLGVFTHAHGDDASTLSQGLSELMAYSSPEILSTRRTFTATSDDGISFRTFMANHPRLTAILREQASAPDIGDIRHSLSRTDKWFVNAVLSSDAHAEIRAHLGSFIDYHQHKQRQLLPLWESLLLGTPDDLNHQPVILLPIEDTWMRTVGAFLELIWLDLTPTFDTLGLLYLFTEESTELSHIESLYLLLSVDDRLIRPLYRAIAEGVENGGILIPRDEVYPDYVATLMHIIRVAISP